MPLPFHDRLRHVVPTDRWSLAWATAAWMGALVGLASRSWIGAVVVGLAAALVGAKHSRLAVVCAVLAGGIVSGAAAASRIDIAAEATATPGAVDVDALAVTDPIPQRGVWRTLVRIERATGLGTVERGAVVALETADEPTFAAGDGVFASGSLRDRPGRLRGDSYRALILDATINNVAPTTNPLFGAGNSVRRLVLRRLRAMGDQAETALLAGFLVGDTTRLPQHHLDNLREAGLTHFVAVSGSNVALFLAAWWLVSGPLLLSPRLRAVSGLAVLVIFVVATRWEPSVVRAATMAAVVLVGRIVAMPVDPWRALGTAVTALLLVSGDLAIDVGFQLSVGATAGVLAGLRVATSRRPLWLWRTIAATVAAQLAVLPVLLVTFGTVPLLSPVANVLAAPLVTIATTLGGIGVLAGIDPLAEAGLVAGRGVLAIAGMAAGWPQLDAVGAVAVVVGAAALRVRAIRPMVLAGAMAWAAVGLVPPVEVYSTELVFLDVGQGDAALINDVSGQRVLVDGGGDPEALAAALNRHNVRSIDLLVITHGDADHVAGLVGSVRAYGVKAIWYPALQTTGDLLDQLLADARSVGITTMAVRAGATATLGQVRLHVLSPGRRYASDNDGSVVLWVETARVTALLTGDIEAVAQAELPPVRPDVLQIPHHGSTTTDLRWIRETAGLITVISVGDNSFGHPSPLILDTLDALRTRTYMTIRDGDVVIPLQ